MAIFEAAAAAQAIESKLENTLTDAMVEVRMFEEPITDVSKELEPLFQKRSALRREVLYLWVKGDSLGANKQVREILKLPWTVHGATLTVKAKAMRDTEAAAASAAAHFEPVLPAEAQLEAKSNAHACQRCAVVFSSFRVSMVAAVKHRCRSCGRVICNACSPRKAEVYGYSTPQRVCTACVEAKIAQEKELKSTAAEAVKSCTEAQVAAQCAVDDDAHSAPELKEGSAASILASAVAEATIAGKHETVTMLQKKLDNVGEASFLHAIALDVFPIGSIVRASAPGINTVASGTVGKVTGHTPSGKVEVRLTEGEKAVFEVASLSLCNESKASNERHHSGRNSFYVAPAAEVNSALNSVCESNDEHLPELTLARPLPNSQPEPNAADVLARVS